MTKLQNVIQPEVFTEYVTNRTMELSALLNCGIMTNDTQFDILASSPNTLINMPFWQDLEGIEETVEEGGYYKPLGINASKDVARKQMVGNMWASNNLTSLLSGSDPMAAIGDLVASYWSRNMQARLLCTLAGIFKAPTMAEKVHDISMLPDADGLLSGESFIDATQLMGDAKALLTGIMMHSATEAYLAKRDMIQYLQESTGTDRIPYFMGKRVIVDDAMPYDTASKTSCMYIFGQNAIALGNGKHKDILETELDRDAGSHAGEDYLINRKLFIMHPRGVKWTESSIAKNFPDRKELVAAANWERVFEPKQVRIVLHTFRLG